MHFTISPFGSAGDVFPLLGLALQLRDRGHEISFVTTGYFADAVRRHGLEYVELGTKEEFLEAVSHPNLWSQSRSFGHVFANIASVFRRHYDFLKEQNRKRKTVAVSSCLGFGARIAQEKLGIPLVSIHLQPAVFLSKVEPPMLAGFRLPRWFSVAALQLGQRFVLDRIACPALNQFRGELGLPPMSQLMHWWHSPEQNVCLFPEWFAAPQPDWPPHTAMTDFPLWDDRLSEPLSEEVAAFLHAGSPPIVFTPGSANIFGRSFFQAAMEACDRLGRRGIFLSKFPDQIPQNLPAEMGHFDYVPLAKLLPRAAALVHHGGVGTTAQGFAAGIPQLIMASAHDQFDNGARVRSLGVGEWLYSRQFVGRRVAKRLDYLLHDHGVAGACRSVAENLTCRDGLLLAADAVEAFVATRR